MDPFLDPESQPNPFEPENWAQTRVDPEKRVGFGCTYVVIVPVLSLTHYDAIEKTIKKHKITPSNCCLGAIMLLSISLF